MKPEQAACTSNAPQCGEPSRAWISQAVEGGRRYCLVKGINIADFRLLIYALALVLMMILRPSGLFGLHEAWEFRLGRRKKEGPET